MSRRYAVRLLFADDRDVKYCRETLWRRYKRRCSSRRVLGSNRDCVSHVIGFFFLHFDCALPFIPTTLKSWQHRNGLQVLRIRSLYCASHDWCGNCDCIVHQELLPIAWLKENPQRETRLTLPEYTSADPSFYCITAGTFSIARD